MVIKSCIESLLASTLASVNVVCIGNHLEVRMLVRITVHESNMNMRIGLK